MITPKEERKNIDANIFIDRAIAQIKEDSKEVWPVAGINGILSLLQYAKESHTASIEGSSLTREFNSDKYYWCKCEGCGWEDSSEFTEGCHPIGDSGDYTDPVCPVCGCNKLEGEPIFDTPQYEGVIKIKLPLDMILDPYKKTIKNREDIIDKLRYQPFVAEEKQNDWVFEKPEFKEDCILLTATKSDTIWEYNSWLIIALDGEDDNGKPAWYWGWCNIDGEEYGDISDLQADKYKIIPLLK
jgi:hypothetical protein